MTDLMVAQWANSLSSTGAALEKVFHNAANIGVRWSLDGFGVEKISFDDKVSNAFEQYDIFKNSQGKRMGVFTPWMYRPITGFCTRVEPFGDGLIRYEIQGVGVARMEDEVETSIPASADTIGDVIDDLLTNHVAISSDDLTQVTDGTAAQKPLSPELPEGETPKEYIERILKRGDNSDAGEYDFWFIDEPLLGQRLQKWQPYYKKRTPINPTWIINRSDTSGITLSRSIDDIKTDVTIYYGTTEETVTTADATGTTLTATGATFVTNGVQAGDKIVNLTDGSTARVESVTSETVLVTNGLRDGTDDQFDLSDSIMIQMKESLLSYNDTVTAVYWDRVYVENQPDMTLAQATQYAQKLLNAGSVAQQVKPFTITAPTVRDTNGARWPLWEMIAQGGGYIRINDLHPTGATKTSGLDTLTTFKITALDYDHDGRQMRVNIDNPDRRLDARLLRAGILDGTIISRGRGISAF